MIKLRNFFRTLALTILPIVAYTQQTVSYNAENDEHIQFVAQLKATSNDSAIVNALAKNFLTEAVKISEALRSNSRLTTIERDKAARSFSFLLQELSSNLSEQKMDVYEVPGVIQAYKSLLTAILQKKPITRILEPLSPRHSQILTAAFSQYDEHALLDDISVFKRVSSSPQFILQFLEAKPNFRFADSLVLEAAAHDPMKVVMYLNRDSTAVNSKIRNGENIYLRQIVSLSGEKNASELLPFIVSISNNNLNPDEILEKRRHVIEYYQLLVNTLKEASAGSNSARFIKPLRDGIRQKSLAFFVHQVNDLHDAADAVRFASVKDLRAEDLYYVITSSGDELYTSSYLGLYKRLMQHFKTQNADSLFDLVKYDNFRTFMRLAANYNVLADFLKRMPQEKSTALLKRFISGVETERATALEKAMDVADAFGSLETANETAALIETELQANLARCTSNQQYLGIRLYGILLQIFELVNRDHSLNKLWSKLGNYEILQKKALENANGEIVQLMLFYGDEDGVSSFSNFLKQYANESKWKISRNQNWVSVKSTNGQPLTIYANMPLDAEKEKDLEAQDSLLTFLKSQKLEPTVLIHRGHSYHLDKTLKRLEPSMKLAILGSCGAYNKAISVATINPDVQVIGSKKTGSKSINDPIIHVINETLLNNGDLSWKQIWETLNARFRKDETALSMFSEYFSPNTNISLFVLKLFAYYNRSFAGIAKSYRLPAA